METIRPPGSTPYGRRGTAAPRRPHRSRRRLPTPRLSCADPDASHQRGGEIERDQPRGDARRCIADREAVVVMLEHPDGLDLHGGEGGQATANPGSEQWAPITRHG